jgi:hypothetical protein
MHTQSRPALLTAAIAVASKPQMLFDANGESHRLCGYFVPAAPMMELIRVAMDADKTLERLNRG